MNVPLPFRQDLFVYMVWNSDLRFDSVESNHAPCACVRPALLDLFPSGANILISCVSVDRLQGIRVVVNVAYNKVMRRVIDDCRISRNDIV